MFPIRTSLSFFTVGRTEHFDRMGKAKSIRLHPILQRTSPVGDERIVPRAQIVVRRIAPSMNRVTFKVDGRSVRFAIRDVVLAGWSGRDSVTVQRHIVELQAIGVAPPKKTPTFYRVTPNLLTTRRKVVVAGPNTSGEVEFVLVAAERGLLVGVGSDQTDRSLERLDIAAAKQVCPKIISTELWPMDEVLHDWDHLVLRCWSTAEGRRMLFQEGRVSSIRLPDDLIREFLGRSGSLAIGTVMFSGTIPSKESISGAQHYEIELEDPIRKRIIQHRYSVSIAQPWNTEEHVAA
jgi:hypothetical protein